MPEATKISLPVLGLACSACASSVQSMVQATEGVLSAAVNYANKTLRLEYDAGKTNLEIIRDQVRSIGYDLLIEEDNKAERLELLEKQRFTELKRRLIVAIIFSLPVFVVSMFFHHQIPYDSYFLMVMTLPVILYSGAEFYKSASRQIRHLIFSMDSLVTTGTWVAFLFSVFNTLFPEILSRNGQSAGIYFESSALIITFVLLGRFMEDRARRSATSSLRKLGGLQPRIVTLERDNELFELPFSLIIPGDKVKVKPGDKMPVDGIILEGTSLVDESSITGEPLPVTKEKGDQVYAGTINQGGFLLIEAEKPGNNTLLAQIIKLVDEAQSSKPPIQKLVDKISQYFVPVIFLISIFTFIFWLYQGTINQAVIAAVSVLIIACPCALGLATPAALVAGMGRGAKEGLLIRNSTALEAASQINMLLLDKTGTLTTGKPTVTSFKWLKEPDISDKKTLLQIESASTHPLAEAICAYLREKEGLRDTTNTPFDSFEEKAGSGVQAVIGGNSWIAGNARFLESMGLTINNIAEPGTTKVFIARNQDLFAEISLADTIRDDAERLVKQLHQQGIEPVMVSGDTLETAGIVARQTGIHKVYAEFLPDQKGNLVKQFQTEGHRVAMIGDGINDAYALAQADLAFAMGSGSDIAIDSASIVLIKSSLSNVIKSLVLSRSLMRIIRQNLFWAFFYNIITIPVAAGVLVPFTGMMLDPMIAGAAMAMSSITVVMNSLRLRSVKLLSN